jgi:hypothetical protein
MTFLSPNSKQIVLNNTVTVHTFTILVKSEEMKKRNQKEIKKKSKRNQKEIQSNPIPNQFKINCQNSTKVLVVWGTVV